MLDKPICSKKIGFMLVLPTIILLLGSLLSAVLGVSFGLGSGVPIYSLLPFIFLMFLFLCLSFFCMYLSSRYIKNKPLKQDKTLGLLFIVFGFGYFMYALFICIISNITGNIGGYAQPAIAFLLMLILVPLGLGLKNGYK